MRRLGNAPDHKHEKNVVALSFTQSGPSAPASIFSQSVSRSLVAAAQPEAHASPTSKPTVSCYTLNSSPYSLKKQVFPKRLSNLKRILDVKRNVGQENQYGENPWITGPIRSWQERDGIRHGFN